MSLSDLLAVARGERPADLVLRNTRVVNVFTGSVDSPASVAVQGGKIAGIGDYRGATEINLNGAYLAPGLIDAHVHIESSLCTPPQFAAAVVPRGVTTVAADPHEIANVCGVAGVRYMHDASRGLPLRVVLMAPSCVPATHLAGAGAALSSGDLASLLREKVVHGLAEVMNFPGVIDHDPSVIAKLRAFEGRALDGHAPGVTGHRLNAYVASGIGSDHECTTLDEAREKLSRGLYVLIREASNARNLDALLQLVTPAASRRICFCTDDRTPVDLMKDGSIDHMLRRAIAFGIDPIEAFRLCTLNASEWFGLHDRGAVAPGRLADFFVFDDLKQPVARRVFVGGREVDPGLLMSQPTQAALHRSFNSNLGEVNFTIPAISSRVRVIGSRVDQLLTDHLILDAKVVDGCAVADVSRDLLKMAVINRHGNARSCGLGFIQGIGLKRGAIAGTVAHDHHNLVVIGADDVSMTTACRAVANVGGGLVVTDGDQVLASLPLTVAGLMSELPLTQVRDAYANVLAAARELASPLHDPFMAMSFMALEVIPSLKLTDLGLVDVDAFKIVDLFV